MLGGFLRIEAQRHLQPGIEIGIQTPIGPAAAAGGARDRPDGDAAWIAVDFHGGFRRSAEDAGVLAGEVEEVRAGIGGAEPGVGREGIGAGELEGARGDDLKDVAGDDVLLEPLHQ